MKKESEIGKPEAPHPDISHLIPENADPVTQQRIEFWLRMNPLNELTAQWQAAETVYSTQQGASAHTQGEQATFERTPHVLGSQSSDQELVGRGPTSENQQQS